MDKKTLRQQGRKDRSLIPDEIWVRLCDRIQQNAITCIESLRPGSVGVYIESEKSREVSTQKIIQYCRANNIPLSIPKVIDSNGVMIFTPLMTESVLKPNQWHIPEVDSDDTIDEVVPDVIVVPMLAGDTRGFRLGYGKGFYDRYLTDKDCQRIGLCIDAFVFDKLPSDRFDQRLNYIITEHEIIRTDA